MTTPFNPHIYHITHIANLTGILAAGGLWSDAQRIARKLDVTNIGHRHIKNRRLSRPVPVAARGHLGDYVPFNFCNRSVMLYPIHIGHADYSDGQDPIVHLVSDVRAATALQRPWTFTDRHAELPYAEFYDDLGQLDEIAWPVMDKTYWSDDKEERQAEFLVHDFFPWSAVLSIGVHTPARSVELAAILGQAAHRPPVLVQPTWYY